MNLESILSLLGISGGNPLLLIGGAVAAFLLWRSGRSTTTSTSSAASATTSGDATPTIGHGLLLGIIHTFLKNKVSPLTATTTVHEDTALSALASVLKSGDGSAVSKLVSLLTAK